MITIRPIGNDDNGYSASPEWWAGLPDSFSLSVDDIEAIIIGMGWEEIDVQGFLLGACCRKKFDSNLSRHRIAQILVGTGGLSSGSIDRVFRVFDQEAR